MISFRGKTANIDNPIICRVVTHSDDFASLDNDFLLTDNVDMPHSNFPGYLLISKNRFPQNSDLKIFQFNEKVDGIKKGDVLLIDPKGIVTRLYDADSHTNSLFLTEKCNCRCMMCPQPPRKEDIMDWADICVQTIKLIDPSIECLGITGGEPTRNWTGLMRVLDSCNKYLPETKIQLLTNGRIFKDYKKAEELAEIAGNKILIGISIYSDVDGHHDKLCGTRGAFWDSIEGLYNLERVGIPIELRTVIMKENYERLKGFSNFVYRNLPFVAYVVFMAMEPIGNAHKNIKKLWIDPADYMENLEEAIKILSRRDINTLIFNHQLCTLPNNLWPLSVKSISEWKIIYSDECDSCIEKQKCGGFFFSQKDKRSRMIRPIR